MAYREPYTGLTVKYPETYSSWHNAKGRCRNPKVNKYEYYGGRGIKFSTAWERFADFLADMGPRPPGTTLDRIDNDRGYEPGNCRWATREEQMANRRAPARVRSKDRQPPSARFLQAWFDASGLSLEQLAEHLGYSQTHTQYLIRGSYLWLAPQQAVRFEVVSCGALNAHRLVALDYATRCWKSPETAAFLERGAVRKGKAHLRQPTPHRRSGEAVSA